MTINLYKIQVCVCVCVCVCVTVFPLDRWSDCPEIWHENKLGHGTGHSGARFFNFDFFCMKYRHLVEKLPIFLRVLLNRYGFETFIFSAVFSIGINLFVKKNKVTINVKITFVKINEKSKRDTIQN